MNGDKARRGAGKWLRVTAILLLGASAFPVWWYVFRSHEPPVRDVAETAGRPLGVSCLGRIEPDGGVIHVAGPHIAGDPHPPLVDMILVKAGDHVRQGSVLAVFAGRKQLEAALEQAHAGVVVARRRLEQVQAGAKEPDVAAQRAESARLEATLQNAEAELRRYETLRLTDDVTAAETDARRTSVAVLRRSIEQSEKKLESLREVRGSDVHLAEAELQAALAAEQSARRNLEVSTVYAPMDGQVLRIHAHAGEEAGADGLLDMGATGRMYVVAEIYETDIVRVRPGQHAAISGDLLGATTLTGTVERIEPNVRQASVLPGDTAAFADKRIVEAHIRLDRGDSLSGLIDGKVTVVIEP